MHIYALRCRWFCDIEIIDAKWVPQYIGQYVVRAHEGNCVTVFCLGLVTFCENRHRHQCIFFFLLFFVSVTGFRTFVGGGFWFNEFWCIRFFVFVWVFERFRKDYKRWLEWVHLGVEQQFLYRFWGQTDTFVWHRLVKSVSFSVVTHSQSHWHAWKRTIGACCVPYTRAASIREQYMISGWAMCSPSARPLESCTQNIHCTVLIAQRSVIYRWANGLWIQSIFYRMHILSFFLYIYIVVVVVTLGYPFGRMPASYTGNGNVITYIRTMWSHPLARYDTQKSAVCAPSSYEMANSEVCLLFHSPAWIYYIVMPSMAMIFSWGIILNSTLYMTWLH